MKFLALVLAASVLSVSMAAPARVAGQWNFTVELGMGTGHPAVTFAQEGEAITGTYEGRYGASPLKGTVKENKIEFTVSMNAEGTPVSGLFVGTVEGDTMSGQVEFEGAGEGTWSATRVPPKK